MPAPYDYSIGDVPNPAQSFLQGIQAVDVLRKREQDMADDLRRRNQQMAAERAAQQKQQELQALYAEAMKPDATPDVFERLSFAIDPQKAALAKFQQRTDAQQEAARQNIFSVWSPLLAGKPEVALAKVDQQLSAMKNAEAPAQDIQALQAIRQTIVATPELAQVSLATQLSGMGEKGKTLVNNAWEAFKKPVEQRKAEAEAGKAEVDAEFARKEKLAALDKAAAELGLSQANKNKVLAETRKLGLETQQAALALESLKTSGGVDPEKKFAQEEKIRKEWQGRNKVYSELQGTFSSLKESAASSNGPGDIALITGFMKMLDPGSVVRETEFATARDTAGLYTQLQNRLQKAKTGELLDANQRKQYVDLAAKYLKAAQNKADQEKQDLGAVVKNYKLNPENVFGVTKNITVDY